MSKTEQELLSDISSVQIAYEAWRAFLDQAGINIVTTTDPDPLLTEGRFHRIIKRIGNGEYR